MWAIKLLQEMRKWCYIISTRPIGDCDSASGNGGSEWLLLMRGIYCLLIAHYCFWLFMTEILYNDCWWLLNFITYYKSYIEMFIYLFTIYFFFVLLFFLKISLIYLLEQIILIISLMRGTASEMFGIDFLNFLYSDCFKLFLLIFSLWTASTVFSIDF